LLIDEFSYASKAHSLPRQLAIRCIELCSGQPYLKRIYRAYQAEKRPHAEFWQQVITRLNLDVELFGARLDVMPKTGPLVVVANHPYGVLDGIVICWMVSQIRSDFKILINNVLCRAPEMAAHVLPVDFDETREALQTNLSSRKAAKQHLDTGGALIVFPSGAISTTPRFFARRAEEIAWAPLVGQLIRKTRAPVMPIFFEGQNSLLFQMASHVSYAMRAALIFHEVRRRVGTRFRGVIGTPLDFETLEAHLPPQNLARHLQAHVEGLRQKLPN
jgi:putative hemolysin